MNNNNKAVAIDTNLLVVLRATDLLLPPTPSRDHMLNHWSVSILDEILERYHNMQVITYAQGMVESL